MLVIDHEKLDFDSRCPDGIRFCHGVDALAEEDRALGG